VTTGILPNQAFSHTPNRNGTATALVLLVETIPASVTPVGSTRASDAVSTNHFGGRPPTGNAGWWARCSSGCCVSGRVVAGLAEEGAYRWRGIVSVHVRFA
jgi:hypothetical protein